MDRNVFLCANIIRLEIASFGNDETLSETPSGSQSLSVVALSGRCKTKVRFENDMPRLHTKLSYSVIIQRCPSVRPSARLVRIEGHSIPFFSHNRTSACTIPTACADETNATANEQPTIFSRQHSIGVHSFCFSSSFFGPVRQRKIARG